MKKSITIFSLAAIVVYLLSGCSQHIYSDLAKGTDFKKYKMYALIPDVDKEHQGMHINNEEVNHSIAVDASDEMTLRGFKLDTLHPDLLVLVHVFLTHKTDTIKTPVYSSYSYYAPGVYIGPWYSYYYPGYYEIPNIVGYDIKPVTYDEGSIVVDVIERNSNKLLWRGWAEENDFDPLKLTNQVRHKVSMIFDQFPVPERY